jgi:hypothetical protein
MKVGLMGARLWVFLAALAVAVPINVMVYPQVYEPRSPVFNGPDIASEWEWRSMAIREHSWWLWAHFPDAKVSHVGFVASSDELQGLAVGIKFSSWRDEYLGLDVDSSLPPFDATNLGIREQLLAEGRVFSRIHCRDNQEMIVRDSCFYFVAWNDDLLPTVEPEFVAVRTYLDEDSEVALVERTFLESLVNGPLETLPNYWEVDQ